jgi:transcriptional antiterminator Rof (Rho-off)
MHRRRMRLHWQDEAGNDHIESVLPKDLKTEEKREYLIAEQQDGGTLKVRLDRILKAAVAEI